MRTFLLATSGGLPIVQPGARSLNRNVMGDQTIPTEALRDLLQCVQAARDGAHDQSLFAMQCDLVLHRVAQVVPGLRVKKVSFHTPRQIGLLPLLLEVQNSSPEEI